MRKLLQDFQKRALEKKDEVERYLLEEDLRDLEEKRRRFEEKNCL